MKMLLATALIALTPLAAFAFPNNGSNEVFVVAGSTTKILPDRITTVYCGVPQGSALVECFTKKTKDQYGYDDYQVVDDKGLALAHAAEYIGALNNLKDLKTQGICK